MLPAISTFDDHTWHRLQSVRARVVATATPPRADAKYRHCTRPVTPTDGSVGHEGEQDTGTSPRLCRYDPRRVRNNPYRPRRQDKPTDRCRAPDRRVPTGWLAPQRFMSDAAKRRNHRSADLCTNHQPDDAVDGEGGGGTLRESPRFALTMTLWLNSPWTRGVDGAQVNGPRVVH